MKYDPNKHTSQSINHRLKGSNKPFTHIGGNVPNTKTKTTFKCNTCNYEWDTNLEKIFLGKTGCPKCAGRPALTNKRADELLVTNKRQVTRIGDISGTNNKILWQCTIVTNHQWTATPKDVIHKGTGCPHCRKGVFGAERITINGSSFRSKREAESYTTLLEYFNINDIKLQHRYNNDTKHTCDFVIPSKKWWIEIGNIKGRKYLDTLKQKEKWIKEIGEQWFQFDSAVELHQFLCENT